MTRVVLPPGAVPEADVEDVPMEVAQEEEGQARPRRAIERKAGTQPYIVRERVASISLAQAPPSEPEPSRPLPAERHAPRREPKERPTRPASRASPGGRTSGADLRDSLRSGADLRGQIAKTRRMGGAVASPSQQGLHTFAARRGGQLERSVIESSRADGEWKHDLYPLGA
jgi:hypothetical protein